MKVYRVTFVRNEIATINEATGRHYLSDEDYILEHQGSLIFALVKANNEAQVRARIEEMMNKEAEHEGFIEL